MKNVIVFLTALIMFSSCGNTENRQTSEIATDMEAGSGQMAQQPEPPAPEERQAHKAEDTIGIQPGQQSPAINRHIIRTARLEAEIADFRAYAASLRNVIKSNKAWIESEEETHSDYRHQNVLEIRVPVENFDALIGALDGMDVQWLQKKIDAEDITSQVVDIQGRIQAKTKIRERYLSLLAQARNMEDILAIQERIDGITEELESATYNLKNMQAEAAYSTVYLTYFEPTAVSANGERGLFVRLWQGIREGAHGLGNLVVLLVTVWPLWLILGLAYFFWRRRKTLPAEIKK